MDLTAKLHEVEEKLKELAQQRQEAEALLRRIVEQQIAGFAQYHLLNELLLQDSGTKPLD